MEMDAPPTDSAAEPPGPLRPAVLRKLSTVLYAVLGGGGLLWIRLRTGSWLPESIPGRDPTMSVLLGVGLGAIVVAATGILMRKSPVMRWFAAEFRGIIGRPDLHTAAHVAVFSAIGEELLFRGAMQPVFGLVGTSILFGALHIGPDRRYLGWTLFAVVMGFALGGIYEYTGSLLGPIAAHMLINFLNLLRIGREDPPDIVEISIPGTVDAGLMDLEYNAGEPDPRDPQGGDI